MQLHLETSQQGNLADTPCTTDQNVASPYLFVLSALFFKALDILKTI